MTEPQRPGPHLASQLRHFARIPHHERFTWQTKNPEVARREQEVLAEVADAIRRRAGTDEVKVLESGCGSGENLIHLVHFGVAGWKVSLEGIDPSPDSVAEAIKNGLHVREANGLALPCPDHSFDVVFCRDVLHHLKDDSERQQFVSEMLRVVKLGGIVLAVEPNPLNPWVFGLSWIVSAEHGLHKIGETRLRQLLRPDEVKRVAPSALWRALCHYRSPLYRVRTLQAMTWRILTLWERMAGHGPSMFWAYRVYIWNN